MTPRRAAGLLGALALLAGMPSATWAMPEKADPYVGPISVQGEQVLLDPRDPNHQQISGFRYAGGLVLTSKDTRFLHGLSDLKVWPDGRMLSESDVGFVFEGHIVLDKAGRLVGIDRGHIQPMKDEQGRLLYDLGEMERDSEGVAQFPNGDLLLSFEHRHRVELYPANGGPPHEVPFPQIHYELNESLEALALDPSVAPDAYRLGVEISGQTYLCRLSGGCQRQRDIHLEGLELSGFGMLPGGGMAYIIRQYYPDRGNVVRLAIVDRDGRKVDEMELSKPLTVDNFEGVAAVPGRHGALRFYIVADDNFGEFAGKPTDQRTLFMAFDWTPPKKGKHP